jgi:hypothetical protein
MLAQLENWELGISDPSSTLCQSDLAGHMVVANDLHEAERCSLDCIEEQRKATLGCDPCGCE